MKTSGLLDAAYDLQQLVSGEKPNHRWAWYSLDTGNLEVP